MSWARAAQAQAPPAAAAAFSEEARRRLQPGAALANEEQERFESERQRLLDEAERLLEQGDGEAALGRLERAALMRHAADAELAIVRAHMAAGQYRRALAAGAHMAGAHREQSNGAALYVWLLHLGGQSVVARHLLEEAMRTAPGDRQLAGLRQGLQDDWPLAGEALRAAALRAAPYAFAAAASDHAAPRTRVVSTALLLPSGEAALVPRGFAAPGRALWLRNGLGQTSRVAEAAPLETEPALEWLRLNTPLPAPAWQLAPREPFAGSPGCMVEFAPDAQGRAAWPLLRQGFFAGVPGSATRPLGLAAPPGPRGGPVFDVGGRLVGVAVPQAGAGRDRPPNLTPADDGPVGRAGVQLDRLVAVPRLREPLGAQALPATGDGTAQRVGPEVCYEMALRGALQVLVDGRDG